MSTEALEKVSDYVTETRTLLQDTIAPFRYDDASIVRALNLTLQEVRRVRPDLIIYNRDPNPQYFTDDTDADVCIEQPFRQAVLNGVVGYTIERDQEDIEDARAAMFVATMRYMLTGEKPASSRYQQQVAPL